MSDKIDEECIPSILSEKTRYWFMSQLVSAKYHDERSIHLYSQYDDRDYRSCSYNCFVPEPVGMTFKTKSGNTYKVKYKTELNDMNKYTRPVIYHDITINGERPKLVFTSIHDSHSFDSTPEIPIPYLRWDIFSFPYTYPDREKIEFNEQLRPNSYMTNIKLGDDSSQLEKNILTQLESVYDSWYLYRTDKNISYLEKYDSFFEYFLSKCSNDEARLRYLMTFISITEVDSE